MLPALLISLTLFPFEEPPVRAGSAEASWSMIAVPGVWEKANPAWKDRDGAAWLVAAVTPPDRWRSEDTRIQLEGIDDRAEVFLNGRLLGSVPDGKAVELRVPAGLLRPGADNTLSLRIVDAGGTGGFAGPAPAFVHLDEAIVLRGNWLIRFGGDSGPPPAPPERLLKGKGTGATAVIDGTSVEPFHHVVARANMGRKVTAILSDPKSPAESMATFKVPTDLAVDLVLAEPEVRQPLFVTFDERGRLWVMQYLQYPMPAGLKVLGKDGVWRAVYDRVPAPPPNHVRGADRITIHEDTDGDGRPDRHKVFVDGLNIATSFAFGRGGVWVLNPPYLLFYPDRNRDDVPDGPPEVHLEGFGLEDTHSVCNNLQWGPDGWLYAAQGSTVTAAVKRPGIDKAPLPTMGQQIWRYHPETRRFEVFAEGGGNAFGLEMDAGGRIFSGHNGGDTRGFHYVQGGYSLKGFQKHGPLSNPYAFGYFPAMKHHQVPRFTHAFAIDEGAAFPERWRGRLFGVAPLLHHVVIAERTRDGSTWKTRDVGHAIEATDPWFTPVAITSAPDGALYVADWYDGQCAHYRHAEGQIDKSNGRVYRIRAASGWVPSKPVDLGSLSGAELVARLADPNRALRRTVLRLLGDRRDRTLIPGLITALFASPPAPHPADLLQGLFLCGGLDAAVAPRCLSHPNPDVRRWTVRLLGDESRLDPSLVEPLISLARTEPDVEVRGQLASTVRRLPADQALPVLSVLLEHGEDRDDPQVPLLLWWALEAQLTRAPEAALALLADPAVRALPLVRAHLLERSMRRFAAAGGSADLERATRLLGRVTEPAEAKPMVAGLEAAFEGRSMAALPKELLDLLARHSKGSLALGIRRGQPEAIAEAVAEIGKPAGDRGRKVRLLEVLAEVRAEAARPIIARLLTDGSAPDLQAAAWRALGRYRATDAAERAVANWRGMTEEVRLAALETLVLRVDQGEVLLAAIEAGAIDRREVPADLVDRMRMLPGADFQRTVTRVFGAESSADTAAVRAKVGRFAEVLAGGVGSPKPGRALFEERCARCHRLFEKGGNVGPDLTSFRRDDLEGMLTHIVHPEAEIREGYAGKVVELVDGSVVTGVVVEETAARMVVRGGDGRERIIPREEIESARPATKSLMPTGLLDGLTERQLRDLFAYLRSTQPNVD
jgi:putative membrane-bound dehydrogenase-like protein